MVTDPPHCNFAPLLNPKQYDNKTKYFIELAASIYSVRQSAQCHLNSLPINCTHLSTFCSLSTDLNWSVSTATSRVLLVKQWVSQIWTSCSRAQKALTSKHSAWSSNLSYWDWRIILKSESEIWNPNQLFFFSIFLYKKICYKKNTIPRH